MIRDTRSGASRRGRHDSGDRVERPTGRREFLREQPIRRVLRDAAEQIAGSGWHAATHPDDLERHNAKWLACAASGEPLEDEVRFRRADGQYRWHLQRGVPLRDEAGRIVKWYGVLTDIEDRKRAEDKIREQETELRQTLDLAPQIIGELGTSIVSACMQTERRSTTTALPLTSGCAEAFDLKFILTMPSGQSCCRSALVTGSEFELELRLCKARRKLSLASGPLQPAARRTRPGHPLVCRLYRYRRSQEGRGAAAPGKCGAARGSRQGVDVRRDCRRLAGADRRPVASVQSRRQRFDSPHHWRDRHREGTRRASDSPAIAPGLDERSWP